MNVNSGMEVVKCRRRTVQTFVLFALASRASGLRFSSPGPIWIDHSRLVKNLVINVKRGVRERILTFRSRKLVVAVCVPGLSRTTRTPAVGLRSRTQ